MEIVALLTAAKEMGFEAGHIISILTIYIMLKKNLTKLIDEQFTKLISAIKELEQSHNERLFKIETHVGLK